MSHPGLGVMIGWLGGNEDSVNALQKGLNKVITDLKITDKELLFTFADGYKMRLSDEGQSCCEHRYMHTDDDLDYYIGSTLLDVETKPGPEESLEYGDVKESEFLIITISLGQFTIVNYNEHNGYYGGFLIRASKGGDVSPDF